MDTLTIRVVPSEQSASASEPSHAASTRDEAPMGVLDTLRHPVAAFQRMFHIEFELDGCILCDDESLHADLVDLFERSNAPTARPEA